MNALGILSLISVLGIAACTDPLVGTWSERGVLTNNGTATATSDTSIQFDTEGSFGFEATLHFADDGSAFAGCTASYALSGFRWTDEPSSRRVTVTPSADARFTQSATGCTDPRSNVASAIISHAGDPPQTIDYAIPELGLFITGEVAGWHFRSARFTHHTQP